VKVTVLLVRLDLYSEMNEAYAEFFPKTNPARAMVRFGADIPRVLVAIQAVALAQGPYGSISTNRRNRRHVGFVLTVHIVDEGSPLYDAPAK
jgi:hypothetical protein